jgi:hypothetical protein
MIESNTAIKTTASQPGDPRGTYGDHDILAPPRTPYPSRSPAIGTCQRQVTTLFLGPFPPSSGTSPQTSLAKAPQHGKESP